MDIEAKLKELGITLPEPAKPIAAYVPAVQTGNLLFIAGQLPIVDGKPMATGKAPAHVHLEDAQRCARQCLLNGLANIKAHLNGDWSRVKQFVRLGVYVQSYDQFAGHANVANGASELLVKIFGDIGKHARVAVGVNSLPLNCPVEVELLLEVD